MSESPRHDRSSLTDGLLLAKNIAWNLAGSLLPTLAALVAIPLLILGLGLERFGVLALIGAVIGYFGLFDLGLGRALTKLVAEKLGTENQEGIGMLAGTALVAMFLLGVLGGTAILAATSWLVESALEIPAALKDETAKAFVALAVTVPLFTTTAGVRAILESFQQFKTINLVRIPTSLFFFFGPLAVLPFTNNLVAIVLVLAVGRLVEFLVYFRVGLKLLAGRNSPLGTDMQVLGPLLRFSGWLAVSSIIGPVMVYFDRFLIGSLISLEAVAFYTTPYDVVIRLLVVPGALLGVLFPAMATIWAGDRSRGAQLLKRGVNSLLIVLAPASLVLITFASPLLALWLQESFAVNSAAVLQWLAAGVAINALAYVPHSFLQAAGRPDITAKLHILEVPPYLALLWWLATSMGIEGVAIAWTARVLFDAFALFYFAGQYAPGARFVGLRAFTVLGLVLVFAALGTQIEDLQFRMIYVSLGLAVYLPLAWYAVLHADERRFFLRFFRAAESR